ncbi:MAG TPA: hypothetical protein VFH39_05005 [Candidatus Saccharimonadales bacterium]|nr:hypothetical protein [Candidatus Saccharimonadales bacterium]
MPVRPVPAHRPVHKRHAHQIFVALLLVVLLAVATLGYAAAKPLPAPVTITRPVTAQLRGEPALNWPSYGQAAVAVSGFGVLATHGDQTPTPTASIAKVMTALSVLQRKPLGLHQSGPMITMTQADVDGYNSYLSQDGSVVPVQAGEQISEYQALEGMLLPSGNNMADTLARWAFGSLDDYANYANQFAVEHGWNSLHFAGASGFSSDTTGSATDLTKLGMLAMQNPVIADIVAKPSADLPVAGTVQNYNAVLGYDGVVGLKTGNNDGDLGAFLFAAKQTIAGRQVTIVGTIMDAPSLYRALLDSLPLIRSVSADFKPVTVAAAGQTVGSIQVPWHAPVNLQVKNSVQAVTWPGQQLTGHVELDTVRLPVSQHTVIGKLRFHDPLTKQDKSQNIYAATALPKPGLLWRLQHLW